MRYVAPEKGVGEEAELGAKARALKALVLILDNLQILLMIVCVGREPERSLNSHPTSSTCGFLPQIWV